MTNTLLQGMRVIEASAFVAAPLGGMTLAQMGAEVIRIDPPGGGLDYRRWPVTADNVSLFWNGLNKSKKSVVIDLSRAQGRELATALICAPGTDAGMLLTNFPPRGYLDYEQLRTQRDDLIQLTITGDRHGGSAVDYTVNPRIGLPYLTGTEAPGEAVNHVLPAWDLVTGHMAAVGLLAAERHRRQSGHGQHVKLSLEDMALAVMGHLGFIAEAQLGTERERVGNALYGAFGQDFLSADNKRVMVVGLTTKQWQGLCNATCLGSEIEELSIRLNLDLSAEGNRFLARQDIARLVDRWIAQRPLNEIANAFDAHGVCWSHYQSVTELVHQDPACSVQNPLFAEIEQAGIGSYLTPGLPMNFSRFPRVRPRPAPQLGQHTDEVLSELLGLSSSEIGRLSDQGIIGHTPT
jgi:2-methylfumaryl-CoA isomerase